MSPETATPTTTQPAKTVPLRATGIDPNHWYVVASDREVTRQPLGVELWGRAIVLYRDTQGQVQALEDCCPHRLVKLSDGRVVGDRIECMYHGWQFDHAGACVDVPYLGDNQKLPTCRIRTYPVRELDGFIWLWPGELQPGQVLPEPMGLPEWSHLNYIASMTTIDCQGHFSFLIENLMDMYHGHLHQDYQAWASAKLEQLTELPDRVDALYEAQSYYRIDKIWAVAQLFIPAMRKLHPEPLRVSYVYPHWASSLGQEFKIYCLFCPVSATRTRAYLVHFTSLHAFERLHQLPVAIRQWVKDRMFNAAAKLLEGLVEQDVLMIEQEQRSFEADPHRKGPELNPAIAAVQRLIRSRGQSTTAGLAHE